MEIGNSFECYLCGNTYNRIGEPCIHYNEIEMDEEGEVSFCDDCVVEVMNNVEEDMNDVSVRFNNCCLYENKISL